MKTSPWIYLLLTVGFVSVSSPANGDGGAFTYCASGTYADCTEALNCKPSEESTAQCTCKVVEGDSVTTGACQSPTAETLQSRYPGVSEIGVCTSGTNEWAACLGVECTFESGDGKGTAEEKEVQAQCDCPLVRSEPLSSQQYIITGVASDGAEAACQPGVFNSSATPGQVFDTTMFLRRARSRPNAEIAETVTIDPVIIWVVGP